MLTKRAAIDFYAGQKMILFVGSSWTFNICWLMANRDNTRIFMVLLLSVQFSQSVLEICRVSGVKGQYPVVSRLLAVYLLAAYNIM